MHDYRNARAYASAQWAWDNASDDYDAPGECADCNGSGDVEETEAGEVFMVPCPACEGTGWLDCDGEPCEAPK